MNCKICGRDVIQHNLPYAVDGMGNVLCKEHFLICNFEFADTMEDDDVTWVTG